MAPPGSTEPKPMKLEGRAQGLATVSIRRVSSLRRRREAGSTLIELAMASLILLIGFLGGLALILNAIKNDARDKTDSTATVLSQMVTEMVASVPANSTSTTSVTITDCNPTTSSASHTISITGSTSGTGAPLTSGGQIDFTQSAVSGYSMTFYSCQASTGDRQALYDVRWNIKTLSTFAKLVSVAARSSDTSTDANQFAVPLTLKTIVGM